MATPISELPANSNDQALFNELLKEIDTPAASTTESTAASEAIYARQMLDATAPAAAPSAPAVPTAAETAPVEPTLSSPPEMHVEMPHESETPKQGTLAEIEWPIQIKYALTVFCIVFLVSMSSFDILIKMVPRFVKDGRLSMSAVLFKAVLAGLLFFGIDTLYRMQH